MASFIISKGQTVETMLYLSPDEGDEFQPLIATFSIQAHYNNDVISPSGRVSGIDVFVNFNYINGKEVDAASSHSASPTSRTLDKLGDAFSLLHQVSGDSFLTKLLDV